MSPPEWAGSFSERDALLLFSEKVLAVIPRRLTAGLLTAWAVLMVSFTVLMGFYLLVQQLGDDVALTVLAWAGRVCLVFLVIVFVLLVVSLALDRLAPPDES
jgi:TRAP-type C4-dicarboxylate transport system permease large subunit